MGIAGGCVACVALCHGDGYWACRVGGAVAWGLLLGVLRRWRCARGIAAGRVAWVALRHGDSGRVAGAALCHGDCWWACCVGGAVSWGVSLGLLTRAP